MLGLISIKELSSSLSIPIEEDLFDGAAHRAVNMKIEKMTTASTETHEWFTYWLIIHKATNIGIGLVGFKGVPDASGSVEIGYGLNEKYRGNGYMSEAVKALVQWAFQHKSCKRVTATSVLSTNFASQKVLTNAGFTLDFANKENHNYSIIKKL